jgi:hypothetical protein
MSENPESTPPVLEELRGAAERASGPATGDRRLRAAGERSGCRSRCGCGSTICCRISSPSPRASSAGHHLRFVLKRAATLASINSLHSIHAMSDMNESQERDLGCAIEAVETNYIGHTIHCFDGLTITLALASERAQVLRVD